MKKQKERICLRLWSFLPSRRYLMSLIYPRKQSLTSSTDLSNQEEYLNIVSSTRAFLYNYSTYLKECFVIKPKMKFKCEVSLNVQILHDKTYKSLKDIGDDLQLTYQQVADISSDRRNKFRDSKFKYAPDIRIQKIYSHTIR